MARRSNYYRRPGEKRLTVCSWDEVPVLIDLPLAACILGFSVDHTRKMLQQGKIQAHKMGRDWRISKDAFRAYVEGVNNQPGQA